MVPPQPFEEPLGVGLGELGTPPREPHPYFVEDADLQGQRAERNRSRSPGGRQRKGWAENQPQGQRSDLDQSRNRSSSPEV